MLTSSVILATYNGKKYILDQLKSLYEQDLKPDEVIVIDDGSSDATPQIITDFIQTNHLDNWRLISNNSNLGWKNNFFHGIERAQYDIVFPCDQDDIWHKDKISCMIDIFEKNDKISVLEGKPHKFFDKTDISVREYDLRKSISLTIDKIKARKDRSRNTKRVKEKEFNRGFFRIPPGCTLAFRKKTFDELKQYWFEGMPHDALMSYFPLIRGEYYEFDYEIIEYRQHIGSTSRPAKTDKEDRIIGLELNEKMLETLLDFSLSEQVGSKIQRTIRDAMSWNRSRQLLVMRGKKRALSELIRYIEFYPKKRVIFTDIKYGLDINPYKYRH